MYGFRRDLAPSIFLNQKLSKETSLLLIKALFLLCCLKQFFHDLELCVSLSGTLIFHFALFFIYPPPALDEGVWDLVLFKILISAGMNGNEKRQRKRARNLMGDVKSMTKP